MPSESALEESRRCRLGTISYAQPFDWLARGWRDMLKKPVPALAHGLVVALFGISLLLLAHRQFWLLAGAFSGFLMIGPLAATVGTTTTTASCSDQAREFLHAQQTLAYCCEDVGESR